MRAGFQVTTAIDVDVNAITTHMLNFPKTTHIHKDILTLGGKDIISLSKLAQNNIVGVIGGPPCQGFSSIGHGDVDDTRNLLFGKFFELIEELQPVFYLAENVPGIMNSKYNHIRESAFEHVRNYTQIRPIFINASEYGAPTTRTRVFFIGYRNTRRIKKLTYNDIERMKIASDDRTNVRQALEGLPMILDNAINSEGEAILSDSYCDYNTKHAQSSYFYEHTRRLIPSEAGNDLYTNRYICSGIVNGCIPTKHTEAVKSRFSELVARERDHVSRSMKLDPDYYCPTIRAGTGPEKGSYQAVRPIHYQEPRVITPREAARLQGFPDWFKLPNTIWHSFRQIGNSVSPIVAERILHAIYQKLT